MAGRATKQAALAQEREDAMMGTGLTEDDKARQTEFTGRAAIAQAAILARRNRARINNGGGEKQ
jgi:hypothetical protein